MAKDEPIKSQGEWDKIFEWAVKETIKVVGCSKEQAEKRMRKMLDSHVLDGKHYTESEFQMIVDAFMLTPAE